MPETSMNQSGMDQSVLDQIEAVRQDKPVGLGVVVAGIGGCGCQAVQFMAERGIAGVDFACADTDVQALQTIPAQVRLPLGEKTARGLGAKGQPAIGRTAALESFASLRKAFRNAEMAVIVCGLGGGTGTGAAPVAARAAREAGALVAVLGLMPFTFEGAKRRQTAQEGLAELAREADCAVPVANDRLLASLPRDIPLKEHMRKALEELYFCARDLSCLLTAPSYICLDPADLRTSMAGTGLGAMGTGRGRGRMRARDAVRQALDGILANGAGLESAKSAAYVMTAPEDISGEELEEIGEIVREPLPSKANVIFQIVFDSSLEDEVRVTVLACGTRQKDAGC